MQGALRCRGWEQEAALRLLLHRLPGRSELRNRCAALVLALQALADDETLRLRPDGAMQILTTRTDAPRVRVEAGEKDWPGRDWLSAGVQGAAAIADQVLATLAQQRFNGSLAGKLVLEIGLGGAGGGIAKAASLHGAACLAIEVNPDRIKQQLRSGACDIFVFDLDEAVRILKNAVRRREPTSVGLAGDATSVLSELVRRGITPDLVVQTTRDAWQVGSGSDLSTWLATHPSPLTSSIVPLLPSGRQPLFWVALSGNRQDLLASEVALRDLLPVSHPSASWLRESGPRLREPGLPARVAWLSRSEASSFLESVQDWIATGAAQAPLLFASLSLPVSGVSEPAPPGALELGIATDGTFHRVQTAVVADGTASSRSRVARWVAGLAAGPSQVAADRRFH